MPFSNSEGANAFHRPVYQIDDGKRAEQASFYEEPVDGADRNSLPDQAIETEAECQCQGDPRKHTVIDRQAECANRCQKHC